MNPITEAVLKAGLITPAQLQEMKRFSAVIDPEAEVGEAMPLDMAAKYVEDALQSDKYVLVRETDLAVLAQYTETARKGNLHLDQNVIEVTFGMTPLGEYIIAWKSESIAELMLDAGTYLDDDGMDVYFRDVRELFFGEHKAFMVCVPVKDVG